MALNRRQLVTGTVAAASASSLSFRRARAQAAPVRIGCVQTLSGTAGEPGQDHIVGLNLAIDRFNAAGGLNGRMAELVIRDDRMSATDAVGATRELASAGVNLVFGSDFSGPALATATVAKDLGSVYIVSGPSLMSLTHELFVPNFFRVCANAYGAYRAEAHVMADRYPKALKWGGIVADTQATRDIFTTFASGLREFYRKLHNVEVVVVDPVIVKPGTPDFRPFVPSLMGSGIQGMLLDVFAGDALTFLQQAKAFNFYSQVGAIGDISLNLNLGKGMRRNTPRDIWSVTTWAEQGFKTVPMAVEFAEQVKKITKQPFVNQYHAQGNAAMSMLLDSVRIAKSAETPAVIAAMESNRFDTVYGPLAFRKEDHQVLMNPGMIRMNPAETELGWEVSEFVAVPWQEVLEPASPGKTFTF